ncbi:hypothetical protein EYF80_023371 [Liparis tanakae]|uniref:Uncharacterized protein n=1 Tax=Liparis tanakae TaxID=230148 RepID=A0A4Z2HNB5_9TELE|nr:hypothetical protein EYF80_023371 [Liparis tanakae]
MGSYTCREKTLVKDAVKGIEMRQCRFLCRREESGDVPSLSNSTGKERESRNVEGKKDWNPN